MFNLLFPKPFSNIVLGHLYPSACSEVTLKKGKKCGRMNVPIAPAIIAAASAYGWDEFNPEVFCV